MSSSSSFFPPLTPMFLPPSVSHHEPFIRYRSVTPLGPTSVLLSLLMHSSGACRGSSSLVMRRQNIRKDVMLTHRRGGWRAASLLKSRSGEFSLRKKRKKKKKKNCTANSFIYIQTTGVGECAGRCLITQRGRMAPLESQQGNNSFKETALTFCHAEIFIDAQLPNNL